MKIFQLCRRPLLPPSGIPLSSQLLSPIGDTGSITWFPGRKVGSPWICPHTSFSLAFGNLLIQQTFIPHLPRGWVLCRNGRGSRRGWEEMEKVALLWGFTDPGREHGADRNPRNPCQVSGTWGHLPAYFLPPFLRSPFRAAWFPSCDVTCSGAGWTWYHPVLIPPQHLSVRIYLNVTSSERPSWTT